MKDTLQRLQDYMSEEKQHGRELPNIRFYDGTCAFSDPKGRFKAKTLEQSLQLFLDSVGA
jgi:hypothetical protein